MDNDNTREAAWIKYRDGQTAWDGGDRQAFESGFDAGAASVDRVQIVHEAFKQLRDQLGSADGGYGEAIHDMKVVMTKMLESLKEVSL